MNAIIVSQVDYAAEPSLTLPYNRHHFDRVIVVTSLSDARTTSCPSLTTSLPPRS